MGRTSDEGPENWIIPKEFDNHDGDKHWTQTSTPLWDESILSWFVRTVRLNCADPDYIYRKILKIKVPFREIDKHNDAKRELLLKLRSFINTEMCGTLENLYVTQNTHLNRGWAVRYCPYCICDDPIPYFRYSWFFSKFCRIHRSQLIMMCPSCNSQIAFWKCNWKESIRHCYWCNYDFGTVKKERLELIRDIIIENTHHSQMIEFRRILLDELNDRSLDKKIPDIEEIEALIRKRLSTKWIQKKLKIGFQAASQIVEFIGEVRIVMISAIRSAIKEGRSNPWIHENYHVSKPLISELREEMNMRLREKRRGHATDKEIFAAITEKHTQHWIVRNFHTGVARIERLKKEKKRRVLATDQEIQAAISEEHTRNWIVRNLHTSVARIERLKKVKKRSIFATDQEILAAIAEKHTRYWIVRNLHTSFPRIERLMKEHQL